MDKNGYDEGYCLRCKSKQRVAFSQIYMNNGRLAGRGQCPRCMISFIYKIGWDEEDGYDYSQAIAVLGEEYFA